MATAAVLGPHYLVWDQTFASRDEDPLNLCGELELPPTTQLLSLKVRKPFDALAEGLDLEKSRGDRTTIEPFFAGVLAWEGRIATIVHQIVG